MNIVASSILCHQPMYFIIICITIFGKSCRIMKVFIYGVIGASLSEPHANVGNSAVIHVQKTITWQKHNCNTLATVQIQ